jgi:hypothetical protein
MNLNIPASLDDLNLDPFEVRLFLRLTRRNLTNATPESLPNMARACRIGERKAQQALKTLLDLNMIHAIVRPGFTTTYHVNQEQLWRVQILETPASPAPPHQVRTPETQVTPARDAPPQQMRTPETIESTAKNPVSDAFETLPPHLMHPRSTCTPASGADLDQDLDVDVQDLSFKSEILFKPTSTSGVQPTPAGDAPPHQVQTLLEDAGLLEAALEVCATLNQTALESRLTALEHDLTRLGRVRIARALHASLENATQSRWGYYRAVLVNIDTLTGSRRTHAGDAHPTPAPPADLEIAVQPKRQKTMAELLASTPLNGTWGRG